MKCGDVVVIHVYYNYTKFLQNRTKKSFINSPFFCSEFQSVSRIVKIVYSAGRPAIYPADGGLGLLSSQDSPGIQCTSIDACSSPELVEEGWFSSISQSIRFPTTEWSPLDTATARAWCPPGLNGSTTMDSVPLISARQNGQPPPPSESYITKVNKYL